MRFFPAWRSSSAASATILRKMPVVKGHAVSAPTYSEFLDRDLFIQPRFDQALGPADPVLPVAFRFRFHALIVPVRTGLDLIGLANSGRFPPGAVPARPTLLY